VLHLFACLFALFLYIVFVDYLFIINLPFLVNKSFIYNGVKMEEIYMPKKVEQIMDYLFIDTYKVK